MNIQFKECIELIKNSIGYKESLASGSSYAAAHFMKGAKIALTTPSIYKAAGLTEATPLTDEELENEAERLYPYPVKIVDEKIEEFDLRITIVFLERAAHIKARKMGSGGWVSVEDSEKFFQEFCNSSVTVLCPVFNIKTKQTWWELYHVEMDNCGELFYVDGSGDCGFTYKDVSYYRVEKFPPLPSPPKTEVK